MKFTLEINNTDNAAFTEYPESRMLEVARILRDAAKRIEQGNPSPTLRDVNGNTVGVAHFEAS